MSRQWTVFEIIMDEYSKLIADVAIGKRSGLLPAVREGTKYWSFQNRTFKKLVSGGMTPSTVLRENKLLVKGPTECAYCGATGPLQWEHIIPKSRGGPDTMDNLVLSCSPCNAQKSSQNPVEWYFKRRLRMRDIPRLVMGKLLKLVLEEHRRRNTLAYTAFPGERELTLSDVFGIFEYSEEEARRREQEALPKRPTDPSRREIFTIGQKGVVSPASLRDIVAALGIEIIIDIRANPPSRGAWSQSELRAFFGPQYLPFERGGDLSAVIASLRGRVLLLESLKDPWESPERIGLGDEHPEWEVVHIHHDRHRTSPVGEAECIPHRELVAALRDHPDGAYRSFSLEQYSTTSTIMMEHVASGI